ncbi:MAG: thiamine pyrophosphate-binding protein [Pigmentiphaga sp.]
MNSSSHRITVGELAARFLEQCGVKIAFGVISIHNMPILDAISRRGRIRFISSRGEAGACNMADAAARISSTLGAFVTSTGTGAGNAAGALVEAMTAGTPVLHLTGQIESAYLDRDLGYIHEHPDQLGMLGAVGKGAFRIREPQTALSTLREAARLALTPPCGPVSIEIPIDIQKMLLEMPAALSPLPPMLPIADPTGVAAMASRLAVARRPLLWLGGGARGAADAVSRFVDMGWGVVTSVQGRGVVAEDHPSTLGAFNLQKPLEAFYNSVDAFLVVGSRLRSNETLAYELHLPQPLYRIDADALAEGRAYPSQMFLHGDSRATLHALADQLEGRMRIDPDFLHDLAVTRREAEQEVDSAMGPYLSLKSTLNKLLKGDGWWVRDITLSNTIWGNRSLRLNHSRAGVHALGGGIGQGLAMGIGVALADQEHHLGRKTVVLAGDGGFMLNVGELACAVQEKADLLVVLMNDRAYGVIRNIQDAHYGGRHCYVDLHTPDFAAFCPSLQAGYFHLDDPACAEAVLAEALGRKGPVIVEVDMAAWGPFSAKFAGPPTKPA